MAMNLSKEKTGAYFSWRSSLLDIVSSRNETLFNRVADPNVNNSDQAQRFC